MIFWKVEVAQRNCDILGQFFLKHFLHYHLNKQFWNIVCCGYKRFDADVLVFQIELWSRCFWLFHSSGHLDFGLKFWPYAITQTFKRCHLPHYWHSPDTQPKEFTSMLAEIHARKLCRTGSRSIKVERMSHYFSRFLRTATHIFQCRCIKVTSCLLC